MTIESFWSKINVNTLFRRCRDDVHAWRMVDTRHMMTHFWPPAVETNQISFLLCSQWWMKKQTAHAAFYFFGWKWLTIFGRKKSEESTDYKDQFDATTALLQHIYFLCMLHNIANKGLFTKFEGNIYILYQLVTIFSNVAWLWLAHCDLDFWLFHL